MSDRPILLDVPDVLVGDRVIVRSLLDQDAAAVFEAITSSLDHLRPWMPWATAHGTVDDTREYIRRSHAEWIQRTELAAGMFSRRDERFLGGCGLHVGDWTVPSFEIGYWIRRDAEGNGYVTECTRLLTTLAFETLGAARVAVRCDARNQRSAAIPRRLGYRHEGTTRHWGRDTAGQLVDMMTFSMIREEYDTVAWRSEQ